ncbi:hypothetical protein ACFW17_21975 [Streptomyces sp. NPDC058961]|uniref:hypothetical protein n=1 Tax=Streptomyces sp. NPDC058961 TaxID=3346680 RepID=UPI00368ABA0D
MSAPAAFTPAEAKALAAHYVRRHPELTEDQAAQLRAAVVEAVAGAPHHEWEARLARRLDADKHAPYVETMKTSTALRLLGEAIDRFLGLGPVGMNTFLHTRLGPDQAERCGTLICAELADGATPEDAASA